MTDDEAPPVPEAATLAATIKSAFPLLRVPDVPDGASSLPAIVQVVLAAHVARRTHPVVSGRDVLFCVLFPLYLLLANRLRFASNGPVRRRPADHPHSASAVIEKFFSGATDPWFQRYMFFAAFVGIVLPLIAIAKAPREVANLAVPHTFVLWIQIIGESVTMFNPRVHRYVTILVPIGFSIYRTTLVVEWLLGSLALYQDSSPEPSAWVKWALALAALNSIFWTYNLFITLLLKVMPEYLARDKCEAPEVRVVTLPFVGEPELGTGEAKAKMK
ncbi:hypothetical protein ACHAWF_004137 [Thalassiosira exigua]